MLVQICKPLFYAKGSDKIGHEARIKLPGWPLTSMNGHV